ncbi:MAG: NHL repeat-containing protein [Acidobacteriota bacterium]|nr:MAG: NHL repeat-containing protein [Acidobacteriota bacterium]
MLAIIYLILFIVLGDLICRRLLPFVSIPQRLATAVLSGMLIAAWGTYISAWLFSSTNSPMLWGNLLFAGIALAGIAFLLNHEYNAPKVSEENISLHDDKWDWVILGVFLIVVTWLVFITFSFGEGKLKIAHHQWSDFGSNISIMQGFALGHNFPTEYPHFSGDRIRYHFLFYFLAGNLEYLGLNPALSNNILSILSWVSMLALIMAFGSIVFSSKAVGRIAAGLFFFHGSWSIITFLTSKETFWDALSAIPAMRDFLNSGFPYRGEAWGVWSQVVYVNQRHLTSSIGLLLIVLCFLAIRYKDSLKKPVLTDAEADNVQNGDGALTDGSIETAPSEIADDLNPEREPVDTAEKDETGLNKFFVELSNDQDENAPEYLSKEGADPGDKDPIADEESASDTKDMPPVQQTPFDWRALAITLPPYIFCGLILGLSPMWNSAVFVSAFVILAVCFFVFSHRLQLLVMAVVTGIFSLPQVLFLKGGDLPDTGVRLFNFGYTLVPPTYWAAVEYMAYTFALKWPLIILGLIVATWFQRKIFLAVLPLVFITFFLQFSAEALTNHKFLNVWLIFANMFAASGIVFLWRLRNKAAAVAGRAFALILCTVIVFGGVADAFPIKNSFWMFLPYKDDPLVEWVKENTDPRSRFLSFRYVNHGILVAGRRLFHGHPYYSWGAGYPVGERDTVYKKMFSERDPRTLYQLLRDHQIDYVAIDDQLRRSDFTPNLNEATFTIMFKAVYNDVENKYGKLTIFEVPKDASQVNFSLAASSANPKGSEPMPPAANAFAGGEGRGGGQFIRPRGMTVDAAGNIYVADTGNSRIQKFDAKGNFLLDLGDAGDEPGRLREPNGVAVDAKGNIFTADAARNKLLRFNAKGEFEKEWSGPPEMDFYGPRDIAIAANGSLYIVDQGRTRIVRFDPEKETFSQWGTRGDGEGQFVESTGIAVGAGNIFVADNGNGRIQVFDLDGKFIRQWEVPAWEKFVWNFPDIAVDEKRKLLYVSNGWKDQVFIYDFDGNLAAGAVSVASGGQLKNPTSLAFLPEKVGGNLIVLNTGGANLSVVAAAASPQR